MKDNPLEGRHARYHSHFTPTSASWLRQVERFFAEITWHRIRRGTFTDVRELEQAIRDYLQHRNRQPKPFVDRFGQHDSEQSPAIFVNEVLSRDASLG